MATRSRRTDDREDGHDPEPQPSFVRTTRRAREAWDDEVVDRQATTYLDPGTTPGPGPVPDWVITSGDARQRDLGALKSGKEADVHLVERTWGDRRNLLAAKRYRDLDDRMFRDDARYRRGRRTGDRRFDLAVERGSRKGLAFRAAQWVFAEFETLSRAWSHGVAVPYPVQMAGTEVLLEYLGDEDSAAPRLAQLRPSPAEARDLAAQAEAIVLGLAEVGVVHGDLSPYNLLVWRGRLCAIDLPQAVDPWRNPEGFALLDHDVATVCEWFGRRGAPLAADSLYAEAVRRLGGPA